VIARIVLCALLVGLAVTRSARADSNDRGVHRTILPGSIVQAAARGAPGELASAAHPKGTALFARVLLDRGLVVTEWDLATAKVVREAPLGVSGRTVHVARSGPLLHVVVAGDRARYVQVDAATLRALHFLDLGPACAAAIASDGAFTFVALSTKAELTLARIDLDGKIAARTQRRDPDGGVCGRYPRDAPIAVAAGRAYFVLGGRLTALSPDLSPVASVPYTGYVNLAVAGGRVVYADAEHVFEASPDLASVARRDMSVGDPPGSLDVVAGDRLGRVATSLGEVFGPASPSRVAAFSPPFEGDFFFAVDGFWVGDVPVFVGVSNTIGSIADVVWLDLTDPAVVHPAAPL
jgi:hypothetical protein